MSYSHHLANAYCQLPERESSKNMANVCKEEFEDKLYLAEMISIICNSKGEQVWVLGAERLSPLKEKFYKHNKWNLLNLSRLTKFSHLHLERWASVTFKTPRGTHLNHKLVIWDIPHQGSCMVWTPNNVENSSIFYYIG